MPTLRDTLDQIDTVLAHLAEVAALAPVTPVRRVGPSSQLGDGRPGPALLAHASRNTSRRRAFRVGDPQTCTVGQEIEPAKRFRAAAITPESQQISVTVTHTTSEGRPDMPDKSPRKPPSRKPGQTPKEVSVAKNADYDDAPVLPIPTPKVGVGNRRPPAAARRSAQGTGELAPISAGDAPVLTDATPVATMGHGITGGSARIGDSVELRVTFSGGWSSGFDVAAVVEGGFIIRRRSDGFLLPGPTSPSDVRHSSD